MSILKKRFRLIKLTKVMSLSLIVFLLVSFVSTNNKVFAENEKNAEVDHIVKIKTAFLNLDKAYKKGEILTGYINDLSLATLALKDDKKIDKFARSQELIDLIRTVNSTVNSYSFSHMKRINPKDGSFDKALYEDTKKRIGNLKSFLSETIESFSIVEKGVSIYKDGIKVLPLDAPAFIRNSRTLVPLRLISETLGADVKWLEDERAVVIIKEDTVLYIPLESTKYLKNNSEFETSVPASIVNDRTYVPIRFVSEAFGTKVEWLQSQAETGIVFLFTKGQSADEINSIKKRIEGQVELKLRPLNTLEKKAFSDFEKLPSSKSAIEAVTTSSKYSDGIRYEVSDLLEDSVRFLENAEGKTREETLKLIENIRGKTDVNKIIENLSYSDFSFLKHEKYLIYDRNKTFAGSDFFNIYITAIDKNTSEVSHVVFMYTQSERFKDDIAFHSIKISREVPKAESEYKQDKSSEMTYKAIFRENDRVFSALKGVDSSRTSFSIQKKLDDGLYSDEIICSHIEKDDWSKENISEKYKKAPKELIDKILESSKLSDSEKRSFKSSGYRINAFAEISAVAPENGLLKWYKIYDIDLGQNSMLRIFKNEDKSTITNRIKDIEKKNKSDENTKLGYVSFNVAPEKVSNWELTVKFVDSETGAEIKNSEQLTNPGEKSPFVYTPVEYIDDVYKIIDKSDRLIAFKGKSDNLEKIELILKYKKLDIEPEKADIILDEWRLSKYIPDISKALNVEKRAYAKVEYPDESNKYKYLNLPFSEQKISIVGSKDLPYFSYKHSNEMDLWVSPKSIQDGVVASCPVYIKRDSEKNPYTLSEDSTVDKGFYYKFAKEGEEPKTVSASELVSNLAVANINLRMEAKKDFNYRRIAKEIAGVYGDGSIKEQYIIEEPKKADVQYYDAIYNASIGFLNHITMPKSTPKLENSSENLKSVKEGDIIFSKTAQSDSSFNVRPDVMMIYDTEFGETEACFVKSKELRKVNPVSYIMGSFNLDSNYKLDKISRIKDEKKAKALSNALGKPELPVIAKSQKFNFLFTPKGGLDIKTYTLDIDSPELKSKWKSTGYDSKNISDKLLKELYSSEAGPRATMNASIKIGENEYSKREAAVILKKSTEAEPIFHKIEVRGGVVTKIDGESIDKAPESLKTALLKMKLTTPSNENALGSFANEEGSKLKDEKYVELSEKLRGVKPKDNFGWYSEDTEHLVLVERTTVFDMSSINFEFQIPSNINGLETPLDELMHYSRGEIGKINLTLKLNNPETIVDLSPEDDIFIVPNADNN